MYPYRSWILMVLVTGAPFSASLGLAAEPASAPVADAAQQHDGDRVRILIDEGADVNAKQVDGMTALHWAAHHDNDGLVQALVGAGAEVNTETRYGVMPLSLACRNGNARIVEMLLNAGADPNATLRSGESILMTAARTGKADVVQLLIKAGADIDARERNGQTAVMWAAAEGHADVVSLLINAGADYATPLDSGFSPFLFAVREGRMEVVRILLDAGVEVNREMRPKRSFPRAPRRGTTALMLATENGHFELAVALLEAGADPNDLRSGFTPLHALTWVRKPNRGDGEDGDPAPRGSGTIDSLQFARKLVEHGADVNARLRRGRRGQGQLTHEGATPFLFACKTADVPLMRLLVELGADPLLPNADGCTPLMAAAGIGTLAPGEEAGTEAEAVEAVEYLLTLGADVNTVDENGETAMHGAAYKNLPKVVALLDAHGADVDIWNRPNRYGWTPLLIAQGHRPGNFKPSQETIESIEGLLEARDSRRSDGP